MIKKLFSGLQNLGKALQTPAATLPIAGLFLAFGSKDWLSIPIMEKAGAAILENLPLLFAVGTAMGLSLKNKAAAALGGVVGYLVFSKGIATYSVDILVKETLESKPVDMSVLGGIIVGIVSGNLSDKVVNWKIPQFLGFFSGQRLVPIVSGFVCLILAFIFGHLWAPVQVAVNNIGNWMIGAGTLGLFVFGFLNRLLIITGLHQFLNTIIYFVIGSFDVTHTLADGTEKIETVMGEIPRYLAGDPSAGSFTAGFYPIMLFGLPAAALAMYLCSKKEKRALVGGLLISGALTSMLTGITEPIEYTFMLIAPLLYLIHALLTGLSLVITSLFNIKLAFALSAGTLDYILMFNKATNPLYIFPIGIAFSLIYLALFMLTIKLFNLKTPGREDDAVGSNIGFLSENENYEEVIKALGGIENVSSIDFCFTRLRLEVKDKSKVEKNKLKALGASGTIFPGENSVQIIFGAKAEKIANYMNEKRGN